MTIWNKRDDDPFAIVAGAPLTSAVLFNPLVAWSAFAAFAAGSAMGVSVALLRRDDPTRAPDAGSERVAEPQSPARAAPVVEPPVATGIPASAPVAPTEAGPRRPEGLEGPRGGVADDLQRIAGIGPKLEMVLNDLGIYHYDQIAGWTDDEVAWIDRYLRFKGRVERENWIAQAAALMAGVK